MTLVNTETGEIVEFDYAAAERRAERITLRLDAIADNYRAVLPMIREAIEKRDDLALGYRSPGDYVSDRFGQSLAGLGIEVRRAVVGELTEAGLSTRAIAPVVGTNFATVSRDRAHVADATPQTDASASSPARQPQEPVERSTPAANQSEGEVTSDSAPVTPITETREEVANAPRPPAPITGIDGKTYTRPAPVPKPVLNGDDAEYANAEKASLALSRAISKLLEFQHPNMRDGMRRYWSMASTEVPPTPRRDVTPEQMRVAAQGLLTLADEWSQE